MSGCCETERSGSQQWLEWSAGLRLMVRFHARRWLGQVLGDAAGAEVEEGAGDHGDREGDEQADAAWKQTDQIDADQGQQEGPCRLAGRSARHFHAGVKGGARLHVLVDDQEIGGIEPADDPQQQAIFDQENDKVAILDELVGGFPAQ